MEELASSLASTSITQQNQLLEELKKMYQEREIYNQKIGALQSQYNRLKDGVESQNALFENYQMKIWEHLEMSINNNTACLWGADEQKVRELVDNLDYGYSHHSIEAIRTRFEKLEEDIKKKLRSYQEMPKKINELYHMYLAIKEVGRRRVEKNRIKMEEAQKNNEVKRTIMEARKEQKRLQQERTMKLLDVSDKYYFDISKGNKRLIEGSRKSRNLTIESRKEVVDVDEFETGDELEDFIDEDEEKDEYGRFMN
jgi:hypothetical protein